MKNKILVILLIISVRMLNANPDQNGIVQYPYILIEDEIYKNMKSIYNYENQYYTPCIYQIDRYLQFKISQVNIPIGISTGSSFTELYYSYYYNFYSDMYIMMQWPHELYINLQTINYDNININVGINPFYGFRENSMLPSYIDMFALVDYSVNKYIDIGLGVSEVSNSYYRSSLDIGLNYDLLNFNFSIGNTIDINRLMYASIEITNFYINRVHLELSIRYLNNNDIANSLLSRILIEIPVFEKHTAKIQILASMMKQSSEIIFENTDNVYFIFGTYMEDKKIKNINIKILKKLI